MIIGTLVLISKTLYSKDPDSPSMYQTEVGELAEISFEVKGFVWDSESFEVFYADQVVKEFDQSIFVMTHIEQRKQRQGRCVDWNSILCSEHCRHLKHTPSSSVTGLYTGECNLTARRCVVDGWCDIESSHQSRQSALNGIGSMSLVIPYLIQFQEFDINITGTINNTIDEIWEASNTEDSLKRALTSLQQGRSASISLQARMDATCSTNDNQCYADIGPDYNLLQPIDTDKLQKQYSKIEYYNSPDGTSIRQVTSGKGILISIRTMFVLYQFSFVNLVSNFGSFMPYWQVMNLLGFFVLVKIFRVQAEYPKVHVQRCDTAEQSTNTNDSLPYKTLQSDKDHQSHDSSA